MYVLSNGKLGNVQLCFVLIVVCTGKDLHPVAKVSRSWSVRAGRAIFQDQSLKNDARFVMIMTMVLARTMWRQIFVRRMPTRLWIDHPKALPRVVEGAKTQSSCACKGGHPNFARCRKTTT